MKKMKVLWFSNTPAAGDEYISSNGTGGWLKSLDKAIQDKIELHVAFYDRNYPSEFIVNKTTYHQIAPYDKKTLIKRRLLIKLGKNPDLPRYLDIINKVKPDIIHIHGTEKSWIELAKYTNIPVILSIQAILTVMNHKYFSGIEKKYLSHDSKYITSYKEFCKQGINERENLQYINYVLGRTDWDRRCYNILAPHAHYFVSNEILRNDFYSFKWHEPIRTDKKLIVHTTTGSLLFKGLETVCEAIVLLNSIGVDIEWRVAGVSENCEFVRIIKKIMGNDFPKKGLKLLGSLSENILVEKMLEAHVYVSPSHQDNSPNALCEAMLIGMPCISTCAGGSVSILKDGITGIVIQDGDPWAMAGAVLELAKNRKKAIEYAECAYVEAKKRHDKNSIVMNLISTYQNVLQHNCISLQ